MSNQAELKQQHQDRVAEVAGDAFEFGKLFITPILDSVGTEVRMLPDSKERRANLKEAWAGTFMENIDEKEAAKIAGIAANSVASYQAVYDSLPPEEVQASAISTIKGIFNTYSDNTGNERAKQMVLDSLGAVEGSMNSRDGTVNRNHQIAMIVPVTLMQATAGFVTPVPTSKDRAQIFVMDSYAGSTFGDLEQGDIINESFRGQYATMDQFYHFGTGDGTETEFEFKLEDLSINQAAMPIRPHYIKIYHNIDQIGKDTGDGLISGTLNVNGTQINASSVGMINYSTGIFKVKFSSPPAAGVLIQANVDIDIEKAPQLIPTIEHAMKEFVVMPHEAAVTAHESVQAVFAARREFSLEMRSHQMARARNVLAAEKDRKRLNMMKRFASQHFDWPRLAKAALSHSQHYADLKEFFGKMNIAMIQATHKTGIKGMFMGLDAINLVLSAPQFQQRPGYRCINQPHYVGRLGEYEIYCDPAMGTWDGLAIGKGESYGDSGFIAADAISAIHYPHPISAPANGPGRGMTHSDTFYELAFRDIHPYRGNKYFFTFSFVAQQGV